MYYPFSEGETGGYATFASIALTLGFKIRLTGGNFRPYDINGSPDDFFAIRELAIEHAKHDITKD